MFTTLLVVLAVAACIATLTNRRTSTGLLLKGWDPLIWSKRLAGLPPQDNREAIVLRSAKGVNGLAAFFRGIESTFGSGLSPTGALRRILSPALMLLTATIIVALVALMLNATPALANHVSLADAPVATLGFAKLRELRQSRTKAVTDARAILDKASGEKREMTADETKQYDAHFAEGERLKTQIDREERLIDAEREVAATAESRRRETDDEERAKDPLKEVRELLPGYNLPGAEEGDEEMRDRFGDRVAELTSPEVRASFRSFLRSAARPSQRRSARGREQRALQADLDTAGGLTVTPLQFIAQLLKGVDNLVFVRDRATKFLMPQAQTAGVPTMETDVADADWTSELATGSEDSDMAFGSRELHPKPLAKRIKISNKLLRASLMNMEAFVRSRLAYKFGVTEEKAYLTGSGAGQPLGLFTASDDGIGTARDVSSENTTTEIRMNGLLNAKYSLKAPYWRQAAWGFHRDGVKQVSKLQDGNGQYLWQPSKVAGEPDMLLGFPVFADEYIPNTFTTGQYVGIVGDFSYYWIVDALDMTLQRLVELYAETNQTGLIGRRELDGMPVMAEAFARVKLA